MGPDVFLKYIKSNGSLTQSMHNSEVTTMMKQRRVLLANPKPTASQS